MDFSLTEEQVAFRKQLTDFIAENLTPELRKELSVPGRGIGPLGKQFKHKLAEQGLLAVGWPKEYGGRALTAIEQWILSEEMSRYSLPTGGLSLTSVGPTIMRVASEETKQEILPGILRGEIEFALGYSEPNAGTDLASLQTRAVRHGDEYVINGQKIFTSAAHYATHVWLLTRTDPQAPKHRGISLFIVPLDTPGITVRPLWTQSGERTNEVFYEDVRIPAKNLVGEENRGWYYATMALDFERLFPHSGYRRTLETAIEYAKNTKVNGQPLSKDPRVRRTLSKLAVDLEIARLFSLRAAWMIQHKIVPNAEASINKVWLSEFGERLSDCALSIAGPNGALSAGEPEALADGSVGRAYLAFPVLKFGGGTNEIQRNIIAQRGFKMPRG